MNETNEYINKLQLCNNMVKTGKIKEDLNLLELIRDKIYYTEKNGN